MLRNVVKEAIQYVNKQVRQAIASLAMMRMAVDKLCVIAIWIGFLTINTENTKYHVTSILTEGILGR